MSLRILQLHPAENQVGEKILSNEFFLGGQRAALKVDRVETILCNCITSFVLQVYPNGTVGNKAHVSIFLENKSDEPLHISEVVFTFQASGAPPLTWNAPKKELESEDDWGFQRWVPFIETYESITLNNNSPPYCRIHLNPQN